METVFHKPYMSAKELENIKQVLFSGKTGADGYFTKQNRSLLEKILESQHIMLTTSGTHALEIAVQLMELNENDEVIMPTYTFPSTANAVLMHKGRVVFTEINKSDLCIDVDRLEEKITPRTKAIIVVHYGGNACDMDAVMAIADKYHLYVIEDAAQGLLSTYKGKMLGTIGHFGCFSFHETKNISCGEGGALSINIKDKALCNKAEFIRQKGTNRIEFEQGIVNHYEWVEVGSSYCPSELLMAYLNAQLENINEIQNRRMRIFNKYLALMRHHSFKEIEDYSKGNSFGNFNAHIFYVLFHTSVIAKDFMKKLSSKNINAYTHFVPLHLSKMGKKLGYSEEDFPFEAKLYKRLVRLPMHSMMDKKEEDFLIETIKKILRGYQNDHDSCTGI